MVAKIIVGTDEKGFVYPKVQERTDICPICKNRIADVANLDYKESLFLNYRDCCGSYDEIVRTPRYCKQDFYMDTDDFICRSEYRFASFSNKSYLTVVGLETADKLKKAGFKNIYFTNVYRQN